MKAVLYLRVSTAEQTVENQERELRQVAQARGWEIVAVYKDEASSGKLVRSKRPGLKALMLAAHQSKFGLVAAWSVDRLGRSLSDLLHTSEDLRALNIQLYLHKQAVDTTTPTGRMTYQILGAVAEWEREMIRDRVVAGLARAKAQGKRMGRKPSIPEDKWQAIDGLRAAGMSLNQIAERLKLSKSSVIRWLKRQTGWLE